MVIFPFFVSHLSQLEFWIVSNQQEAYYLDGVALFSWQTEGSLFKSLLQVKLWKKLSVKVPKEPEDSKKKGCNGKKKVGHGIKLRQEFAGLRNGLQAFFEGSPGTKIKRMISC